MDPFSITIGAIALIKMCTQVVLDIKKAVETVKGAKKLLIHILAQAERMRLLLEQMRSLTHQLQGRSSLILPFNDSACRETVKELKELVHEIVEAKTFLGLQTLLNKKKAGELLKKLRGHEKEIILVLTCITTSVTYAFPNQGDELTI
jgi:Zn-dependent M16 (insulinase) family peptidase